MQEKTFTGFLAPADYELKTLLTHNTNNKERTAMPLLVGSFHDFPLFVKGF